MTDRSPWWSRHVHADRRPVLMARNAIKRAIRGWLDAQGFVEVEPAALQVSPGNETHLHAFATEAFGTDLARQRLYLHTSPEFAMKKLLAAGETRIYAFAPAYRNRERGALHSPEFTMLEWYRADEPYETLWSDCAALLRLAAEAAGNPVWSWRDRVCKPTAPLTATSVDEAFRRHAGVDLSSTYDDRATNRDALASLATATGTTVAADDAWSDIVAKVLTARVEPRLGIGAPEILHRYPVHEAALARPVPDDPRVAERFELYVAGIELANGFGELTDAIEQRRRFEIEMAEKARIYGERYPVDEDFLAALAHMPPASGCALGFDRLVMLATGAPHIDHVLWTPVAEAGT